MLYTRIPVYPYDFEYWTLARPVCIVYHCLIFTAKAAVLGTKASGNAKLGGDAKQRRLSIVFAFAN
jgi:hypothetical protein